MDIIIDDGDHRINTQLNVALNLKHLIAPGGYYILEDTARWSGNKQAYHLLSQIFPPREFAMLSANELIMIGRCDDV
jgi:hypothetical protein